MNIVIAPDSFKESMTAMEVADMIEEGFTEIFPHATYIKAPMADGGEGTTQSLVDATHGRMKWRTVTGPLGTPVEAFYGLSGDGQTAIIEMAAASGLDLVPPKQRNPMRTTTYGTGELILAAIEEGVSNIIIGIGGSATNDGGAGMAQALGAKLLDKQGQPIGFGGGSLNELSSIDCSGLHPKLASVTFQVACDVTNPLTGPNGASAVYGPQKGATPEMVEQLDQYLNHYAAIIQRDIDRSIAQLSGAGAAGGLGAGLLAFLDVELKRGIDIVVDVIALEDKLKNADLVITGEGRMDSQTIYGKTPMGVAELAKKYGIPVIGIAGSLSEDSSVVHDHGIDAIFSIVQGPISLDKALTHGKANMKATSRNIAKLLKIHI